MSWRVIDEKFTELSNMIFREAARMEKVEVEKIVEGLLRDSHRDCSVMWNDCIVAVLAAIQARGKK